MPPRYISILIFLTVKGSWQLGLYIPLKHSFIMFYYTRHCVKFFIFSLNPHWIHMASKWQRWDWNPGLSNTETQCLNHPNSPSRPSLAPARLVSLQSQRCFIQKWLQSFDENFTRNSFSPLLAFLKFQSLSSNHLLTYSFN